MLFKNVVKLAVVLLLLGVAPTLQTTAHAAPSFNAYGPLQVDHHPIVYVDQFSPSGQDLTDAPLGLRTHWSTTINVGDPTSTITWHRVLDAGASTTTLARALTIIRSVQLASQLDNRSYAHPHLNLDDCNNAGGAKLNEGLNYNGNCGRFTNGPGTANLASLAYPNTCLAGTNCHYLDHSQSLRTLGSAARGHLSCNGASPSFGSNIQWPNLALVDTGCIGEYRWIYSITLDV